MRHGRIVAVTAALGAAMAVAAWRLAPPDAGPQADAPATAEAPAVGHAAAADGTGRADGTVASPASAAGRGPAAAFAASAPTAASGARSAAASLADAYLHGERRAPPIDPPEPASERATPWELADPALYRAREQRATRELEARFVQAAQQRLEQQRAALAEAQARGASPADLARADDKIRHLEAAQAALVEGAASAPPGGQP
jgi:hypothetical protein